MVVTAPESHLGVVSMSPNADVHAGTVATRLRRPVRGPLHLPAAGETPLLRSAYIPGGLRAFQIYG
jgi:hypothetical protein